MIANPFKNVFSHNKEDEKMDLSIDIPMKNAHPEFETPITTPVQAPFLSQRTGSVTSIASSVSDFGGNYFGAVENISMQYQLTPEFAALLLATYNSVSMDPTITPFQQENPPSSILNMCTKYALAKAAEQNVEVGIESNGWQVTVIRHKLLEMVRQSYGEHVTHQPSTPQFGVGTPLGPSTPQNDYFGSWLAQPVPLSVGQPFQSSNGLQPPPSFGLQPPPQFGMQQSPQFGQNSPQFSPLQPGLQPPIQPGLQNRSRNNSLLRTRSGSHGSPLMPPVGRSNSGVFNFQKERSGSTLSPLVDGEQTQTLHRKKDSLNMKRGNF